MTVINAAEAGILGLVPNTKEQGKRVDFKPNEYDNLIEGKGYRVSWERAALCPCAPVNDQTDQADPNCTLCDGKGWIYFLPVGAVTDPAETGVLDALQTAILGTTGAVVRALITNLATQYEAHDFITARVSGTSMATVRAPNQLGYHDRLTNLDSLTVYSQLLERGGDTLPTKYLCNDVNLLRDETTVYVKGTDFTVQTGVITWEAGKGPVAGTPLACHYLMHPTWVIIEHPHSIRVTPVKFKTPTPLTPRGDPRALPVQGLARLEWLL